MKQFKFKKRTKLVARLCLAYVFMVWASCPVYADSPCSSWQAEECGGSGGGSIGDAVGGGTADSVLFIGAGGVMAQDNTNLKFDDANNRLFGAAVGIGSVNTGSAKLENYSSSADNAIFQDTGGTLSAYFRGQTQANVNIDGNKNGGSTAAECVNMFHNGGQQGFMCSDNADGNRLKIGAGGGMSSNGFVLTSTSAAFLGQRISLEDGTGSNGVGGGAFILFEGTSTNAVANSGFQALRWDVVSSSANWGLTYTVPITTITLPYPGIVAINIFDCDFSDAGSTVGARGIFTRKDTNVITTRAGAIIPAASIAGGSNRSVISYQREMLVASTSTVSVYASQGSTGTLNMACVSLSIKYLKIGTLPATGAGYIDY